MSEYISDHILANIFVRLSFKSLNRFRCVSKSWRDFIDSKYITGLHSSARSRLCQTIPHPDSMILELVDGKQVYVFDYVAKKAKGAYEAFPKQLSINFRYDYNFTLAGSCNGILCLNSNYWQGGRDINHMVLWNPFTRTYVELPPLPDDFESCHPTKMEAFGYDHVNDDYKVVKFYVSSGGHYDYDRVGCHGYDLCVYSLKQNSWRTIMDGIPYEMPKQFLHYSCTVTNGAAHWLVYEYSWINIDKSFILAFDLATYEFGKISFSPSRNIRGYIRMTSLNGSLSLVCNPAHHLKMDRYFVTHNGFADVWVMEEYGVETSWNKLTSIEFPPNFVNVMPVVFIEKRGKLLLQTNDQKLLFYDINRKSFSQVSIKRDREDCTGGSSVCEKRYNCISDREDRDYFVCVGTFASPFTS